MATDGGDPWLGLVVIVAGVLGLANAALGALALAAGQPTTAATTIAVARTVLGALLLPTVVGLVAGAAWSRPVGVVALGGIALVELLPLLAGETLAVPLLGILLASVSALYLLLAPGEFASEEEDRALDADTDPHRFVR